MHIQRRPRFGPRAALKCIDSTRTCTVWSNTAADTVHRGKAEIYRSRDHSAQHAAPLGWPYMSPVAGNAARAGRSRRPALLLSLCGRDRSKAGPAQGSPVATASFARKFRKTGWKAGYGRLCWAAVWSLPSVRDESLPIYKSGAAQSPVVPLAKLGNFSARPVAHLSYHWPRPPAPSSFRDLASLHLPGKWLCQMTSIWGWCIWWRKGSWRSLKLRRSSRSRPCCRRNLRRVMYMYVFCAVWLMTNGFVCFFFFFFEGNVISGG